MQPQRLPVFFLLLILFPALSVHSASSPGQSAGPSSNDGLNTNELNSNEEEPQIDLPERSTDNKFRMVARSTRKPSNDRLVELCKTAVDTTSRRLLSTQQHTPWQIMHGLLGLRDELQVMHNGQPVSGLDWITRGQVFQNEHWFQQTNFGGRAHPYSRPYAFEGHANQFLAILSMCGVELDQTFGTSGKDITMKGMIRHAQMTVTYKDEPTWTLWALSRYLPSTATWRNRMGEAWSIEKLVQVQTAKPMRGAPCGGTHGLFALAHARNVYLRQGKQLRGTWLQAEYKIRKYINTARMQQNSNGSLSSNFFRSREYDPDFNKRMASAGHILEFLMIALPQKELNQLWVRRAIEATAHDLMNNRKAFVKCSPLYHSVNALNIYLDRVNPRVKQQEVVQSEPDVKTVQTPKPADSNTAALKTVPVSQGKPVPEATASTKADKTEASQAPEVAETDVNPNKTPTDAVIPDSAADSAIIRVTEPEVGKGWKATPQERRTPIGRIAQADSLSSPLDSKATTKTPSQSSLQTDGGSSDLPIAVPENSNSDLPLNKAASQPKSLPAEVPLDPSESNQQQSTGEPVEKRKNVTKSVSSSRELPPELPSKNEPAATDGSVPESSGELQPVETTQPPSDSKETADKLKSVPTAESPDAAPDLKPSPETAADSESKVDVGNIEEPESQPDTPEDLSIPAVDKKDEAPADDEQTDSADDKTTAAARSMNLPEGINLQFLDPDLDMDEWLRRFEGESREIAAARLAITEAVKLRPGMSVADVGAGTGLFVGLFAEAVGESGQVYALEISPKFVDFLDRRVESEQLENVTVVRNDARSLLLGRNKIDRAFICDTYHHFEYHEEMLASLLTSLNPGGELILVDFDRVPGMSRPWIMSHVRGDKQTFRDEIVSAGFQYVEEVAIPGFEENYLLRFRKPAEEQK